MISAFLIALGAVMVIFGVASWMGWLPVMPRRNRGVANLDIALEGVGVAMIGSTGYGAGRWIGFLGVGLILVGLVLSMVKPPAWLLPGWYRRRFQRPPSGNP